MSAAVLAIEYQLTSEELSTIKQYTQDINSQLSYAVLFMVFKNLGYFPEYIPEEIINHIREQLQIPNAKFDVIHASTIGRHRQLIYEYFHVTRWKKTKEAKTGKLINTARDFAVKIALETSETLNYPADIINVVIEQLKNNNFELPSFNQLDRLVRHARTLVNQKIFDTVYQSLTNQQIESLDYLLETTSDYQRSGYNQLKTPPKNPTLSHFKEC